jgi:hypothetical protein
MPQSDSTSDKKTFCSNRSFHQEELADQLCQMLEGAQRDKVWEKVIAFQDQEITGDLQKGSLVEGWSQNSEAVDWRYAGLRWVDEGSECGITVQSINYNKNLNMRAVCK